MAHDRERCVAVSRRRVGLGDDERYGIDHRHRCDKLSRHNQNNQPYSELHHCPRCDGYWDSGCERKRCKADPVSMIEYRLVRPGDDRTIWNQFVHSGEDHLCYPCPPIAPDLARYEDEWIRPPWLLQRRELPGGEWTWVAERTADGAYSTTTPIWIHPRP